MKIALVYDHINKMGGAERVLFALHELYPDAPLYTLVSDINKAPWATDFKIVNSFVQQIPFAKGAHEYFPVLPVFAFESFDFSDFDIVISVTSAEAKGIITSPNTLHICYLLTPTRYLWSHHEDYFRSSLLRVVSSPFVSWLRIWDQIGSSRPDHIVTISNAVKCRTRKYYRREAKVIYPPVDVKKFKVQSSKFKVPDVKKNYFLVVSRLVTYKHIEIAIEACNELKVPLKIVGEGMDRKRLQKLAGQTIEFVGALTDSKLYDYYQSCRALLFPQEEDYGITAVEALAFGKPVIAYRAGGALEIIAEGRTGEFFYPQTSEALGRQLEKFDERKYSAEVCKQSVEGFSKEHFQENFSKFVKEAWLRWKNERDAR